MTKRKKLIITSKTDVVQTGREIIRADVRLAGERWDSDCCTVQDGNIVSQCTINVPLDTHNMTMVLANIKSSHSKYDWLSKA